MPDAQHFGDSEPGIFSFVLFEIYIIAAYFYLSFQ